MILDSEAAMQAGLDALRAQDAVMARIIGEVAARGAGPPLRKREPGFAGLAAIIVSQQVSTASAKAIWGRVSERFPTLDAPTLRGADDEALRACGLSAPKIRTLRAVAEAVAQGDLPLDDLAAQDADAAHEALVTVKGIGPWTADIYLLFCLGHPDAFAAGDLALQEGARLAYTLDTRPKPAELLILADQWRPWRGVAAKVLWAYYGVQTGRGGTGEVG
ncbi:DNA-3-methyladenine glycosylase 2 family protein [Saliniramus sp.]|uniref:DNA-3-methyladenine glycosylase family protein n=1 Tax=Saliniramus sp. TaxID=2986772 RepID=UPI002BA47F97|nr:DNA-3-methyladenine glycosylase 2 family protein [Saliniramus sp.]HMB09465.1 DNA-3-methyladenine glycosylase 2 family protein [Saliniramus sp.]